MADDQSQAQMLEIMKKAQMMQEEMSKTQEEVMKKIYETEVDIPMAGKFQIAIKGDGSCDKVSIEADMLKDPDSSSDVEHFIKKALNDNLKERQKDLQQRMEAIGEKLGLPKEMIQGAIEGGSR